MLLILLLFLNNGMQFCHNIILLFSILCLFVAFAIKCYLCDSTTVGQYDCGNPATEILEKYAFDCGRFNTRYTDCIKVYENCKSDVIFEVMFP